MPLIYEKYAPQNTSSAREMNRLWVGHTRNGWFPSTAANGQLVGSTNGGTTTTVAITNANMTIFPIIVPEIFVKSVKIEITSFVATSSASVGFFSNIEGLFAPGNLICQSTTGSTAANAVVTMNVNSFLPRGLVWAAIAQAGSSAPTYRGLNVASTPCVFGINVNLGTAYYTSFFGGGSVVGKIPTSAQGIAFSITTAVVPCLMIVSNGYNK